MNKLIQASSLLLCLVVTGSASAMKVDFSLTNNNNKGAAKRSRLALGKRERPTQGHEHPAAELREEVVTQSTSLKKQKPYIDAKKVYSAIRSSIDPVWIHQVYKRLYEAIGLGDVVRVQNLLGFSGMDWNVLVGPLKMTCLHRAALHGNVDIARLLIEKGARLDLTMANGKTALDIAIERGHVELAAYFNSELYRLHENEEINECADIEEPRVACADSRDSALSSSASIAMDTELDDIGAAAQIRSFEMEEDIAVVALVALQRK